MPDVAKIEAVANKLASEGAEPASELTAATPAGDSSGAGSAPATRPGEESASSVSDDLGGQSRGAATSTDIERKLIADRERRAERARARQAREDREAAQREREAAQRAREEAEAEKAKYANLGKGKPFLDTIKELGLDPRQTFEAMKEEALKAGTPEARFEALERAYQSRFESLETTIKAEREAREQERQQREQERQRERQTYAERQFQHDFERSVARPEYESLRDEYPDEQLFGIAQRQRQNPDVFFAHAKSVGVRLQWEERAAARLATGEDLTDEEPTFTMVDILNVLRATQDRHFARLEEQRRKKSAAPQAGPGTQAKPGASRPTVNGTAERNAGTSLGNQLAATTAAEGQSTKGLSREEKVRRLGEKYG